MLLAVNVPKDIETLTDRILASVDGVVGSETLLELSLAISRGNLQAELDPLAVLSPLLSSSREGVDAVLDLLSQSASARELTVAAQELIEYLANADEDGSDNELNETRATTARQIKRLIDVYAHAIPRLQTKKPPSHTLFTTIGEMQQCILPATSHASPSESRDMLMATATLVQDLHTWASDRCREDEAEATRCKVTLIAFLDAVVEACANTTSALLSQRIFAARFPRLVVRTMTGSEWKLNADALRAVVRTSESLGRTAAILSTIPSVACLVLFVHSDCLETSSLETLTTMLPAILAALQANVALDEALALLLVVFFPTIPSTTIDPSPDVIIALSTILPALCSIHPDAPTRHLSFRLLGQVLHMSPPPLRLQVLRDLLAPSEDAFPQMRVAAIGLVKDAVLEGLERSASEPDLFASPLMLATLGSFLLRPDPVDLFQRNLSVRDFVEMDEAKRLVECLAFYYVLLLRDADNKTGIRDRHTLQEVETSLLTPLRCALKSWFVEAGSYNDPLSLLPLAALETNIKRVDEAVEKVHS
ncbi:unnamed protein product [Peniophora sp. CBMAI 1063]|nr:unnamed protein product [Peniophora sp. CBMAI 1063]